MSSLRLFRKEALKHQYKSQEFGEALVQMPGSISSAILMLSVLILVSATLFAIWPVSISKSFDVRVSEANFSPVVTAIPSVVSRHLPVNGSKVNASQPVLQVRFPGENQQFDAVEVINAPSEGTYYATASEGETLPAFKPIAKILRQDTSHTYFYNVDASLLSHLRQGSTVSVEWGSNRASATVQSLEISTSSREQLTLGLQFSPPYSATLMQPEGSVTMRIKMRKSNIFKLLG